MNFNGNINVHVKEKEYKNNTRENEPFESNTKHNSPIKKQKSRETVHPIPVKCDPSRCAKCNKKLKLTAIKCRCDKYFCAAHRYSDLHDCEFDYKNFGKKLLEKQNPTVAPQKVDKL